MLVGLVALVWLDDTTGRSAVEVTAFVSGAVSEARPAKSPVSRRLPPASEPDGFDLKCFASINCKRQFNILSRVMAAPSVSSYHLLIRAKRNLSGTQGGEKVNHRI